MARIKVFLNGHFVSSHELLPQTELLVGRGETCDVVLQPEKGISRQHFRIRKEDKNWIVEVLSRFGEMYVNHQKKAIFSLQHGLTFVVPPYEFVYENEQESAIAGFQNSNAIAGDFSGSEATGSDSLDRTHIGYLPSAAYLRVVDEYDHTLQNFLLEGFAWLGGRDTGSSLYIDNPRLSRKQFEIQKQNDNFYIRNLGQVNTTNLNGRALDDEWALLSSGDVVTVADCRMLFELHDAQYENRLQEVDPNLLHQSNHLQQISSEDMGSTGAQQFGHFAKNNFSSMASTTPPGMKLFGRHIPGLNPVRLGLVVVVLFAGLYALVDSDSDSKTTMQRAQTPFEKLSPDKQQAVKQIYLTAQSLIAQSRYELARQEIIKLHQIIPYYEDSKDIEETANRGLAILAEREKSEAEERQRAELEQKVQRQVSLCRSQMNANSDGIWLESCLAPVMEFNPEHPQILALKNEVDRLTTERAMRAAKSKEYQDKVAILRSLFNKAQSIEQKGLPLPAIEAYQKVAKSSLPDPNGLTQKAKRQIASLQTALESKQAESEKLAESAYRAGQFRVAIEHLRRGIAVNPDNEVLKGKHTQYLKELRKMMMGFYHEGILEESVGDVESAKGKWRKIIEQSLPGEDYYEKAKIKLKKYGAFE